MEKKQINLLHKHTPFVSTLKKSPSEGVIYVKTKKRLTKSSSASRLLK